MRIKRTNYLAILYSSILLATGCSTTTKSPIQSEFYPPAPEQPRLQFLTSFSSSIDFEEPTSAFRSFIVGEEKKEQKIGIIKPYGLAVRGAKLYVCDTVARQVHIIDLENRRWDLLSSSRLKQPTNVAMDSEGFCYIADPAMKNVQIYDSTDRLVGILEGDSIKKPVGIAASATHIFVGDTEAHQVHVFDKSSREILFSIPRDPDNTDAEEKLYAPTNIAIDNDGKIYVSDAGSFRVLQYNSEGEYLQRFGSLGTAPGTFARNKGVAVDKEGNLYVVDAAFQNIQIFNQEGELLLYFGTPELSNIPMCLPASVTIDYANVPLFQQYADPNFKLEYLVFVANQYGLRKIAVYGFGNMIQ